MLCNVDTEDEENRSDTEHSITFILISGRSGELLTSSNVASKHVDVRPTSQRRAVSQLCFVQPPTAADDDNFYNFSHDDIFFQHFRSLTYNDHDHALHNISAGSTMTSLLLCDTAYLSVS